MDNKHSGPRLLLTGPFKPFGVDNIYSRKESIPELFHNQLTHFQGIYSPRKHYPTYGLHLIAANTPVDATVLDWPSFPRFLRELDRGYDFVGIGSIVPNFQKVKRMAEAVRMRSPKTKIIVGGFCATIPKIKEAIGADYLCVGEGISFMRELLGFPPEFDFAHPDVGDVSVQVLGIPMRSFLPSIVTSLGCNRGCDFCSPTHFFGRRHLTLIHRGRQIFDEMQRLEKKFGATAFGLVGDDNFLANPVRARELRDCLMSSGKPYAFGTFGSADAIAKFDPRELAEMGIDSIWIGRESRLKPYPKNEGADLKTLIAALGEWGIRVILSSILLLDEHDPDNIWDDINEHIDCRATFSQFSHLSPAPGTPLWDQMESTGRLLNAIPYEECHAFKQPWFIHPRFSLAEAEAIQREAYLRDFHTLGPSLARLIVTTVRGMRNFEQTDSPPLLARARQLRGRLWFYKSAMYDMEMLATDPGLRAVIRGLREEMEALVGPVNSFHKFVASGAYVVGSATRAWQGVFSDVIQPRTVVTHYPRDWKPTA